MMAICHQSSQKPPLYSSLYASFVHGWPRVCRIFIPPGKVMHGKVRRRSIDMIERLFSSRTLFRTLALFFRYPDEPLNPRLISRHTGADLKCVHRELKKLEGMGIVRGWAAGKYRYYLLRMWEK